MTTAILLTLTHVLAFGFGLAVYRHNAKKAAKLEAKARAAVEAMK